MKELTVEKILAIPSREWINYTLHSLIKNFDFFNRLNQINRATLDKISAEFGFDKRVLDATLSYLEKENFIERKKLNNETFFVLSKLSKKFLLKDKIYDLSNFVKLLDKNIPDRMTEALPEALLTGKPARWNETEVWKEAMKSGAISKSFSEGMMSRGVYIRDSLTFALRKTFSRGGRLIDIGGSLGDYCGKFAQTYSKLSCTVFELSKVAEDARKNISNKGYSRVNVLEGDMFKSIPEGYDFHFYSNVMHDWTTQQIKSLLKNSYRSLKTGGKVIISDMHLNNNKKSPELIVDHSLYLSIFTEGKCYSYNEIKAMLKEEGFSNIQIIKAAAGYSAIIGNKLI